jgi:hypothetical protein
MNSGIHAGWTRVTERLTVRREKQVTRRGANMVGEDETYRNAEDCGNDNVDNLVADNIVPFGGPRDEERALRRDLARLRQEHRDLDSAITALETMSTGDKLQLQRLKKRKLILRDRIIDLEDRLNPDIIA